MESQNPMNTIKYLRLDFHGCEYKIALDNQIRSSLLQDGIDPVIRGQIAPAAGADLGVDIIISLIAGIASDLIVKAIKNVMNKIRKATDETLSSGCCLNRVTIETDTCDFIIATNGNAGIYAEDVDYNELISQMKDFYEKEVAAGNLVDRIETPCDLDPSTDYLKIRTAGVGNFSLWLVTYRNGSRWPFCLYDSVNDTLIPMKNQQTVASAIDGTDKFYRPAEKSLG